MEMTKKERRQLRREVAKGVSMTPDRIRSIVRILTRDHMLREQFNQLMSDRQRRDDRIREQALPVC